MDRETKIFLGKILGEIYRIQEHNGIDNKLLNGRIYGLVNGIEEAVDNELKSINSNITQEKIDIVARTLDDINLNEENLLRFKGFYDIENNLRSLGVSRGEALMILTYFYKDQRFTEIIDKMSSSHSPIEFTNFKSRVNEI